ncbi:MAG: ABC transporter substrate-binding protein [Acidimicrobiaceae bacterium]|nr:ABC transporter substrate-binding protein [Acidimicrobiaceae bacterium]
MRHRVGRVGAVLVSVLLMLGFVSSAAYAAGGPQSKSPSKAPAASKHGGSLTVLLGSGLFGSWTGFDPVITTTQSGYENAVYGALFQIGQKNKLIPDLATGYKFSNGDQTLTIHLRPGVTFSNGDPFNSSVVAYNFKRSIDPTTPNGPLIGQNFPMTSVSTPDNETVVVNFSHVFAGVLSSIPYILDPVALQKMGEVAYNLNPVGAGPFTVASDKPSASLVLKRNPKYWRSGFPKLDTLNIETTGSDESAYEAMQSGQGQVYIGLQNLGLVAQAKKSSSLKLYSVPPTGTWALQLNAQKPPLNNKLAREALYYATNPATINKHLFGNHYKLTQSPTGPGGLFYTPKVPGYRTYNLAKAKALVKQLGGLNLNLATVSLGSNLATFTDDALQTQWKAAGINANLVTEALTSELQQWHSGAWNVFLVQMGSYDPATGFGLPLWFGDKTFAKGVTDPTLVNMMNQAQGTFNNSQRATYYKQIFKYLSDQAYAVFLFTVPAWNLTTNNVTSLPLLAGLGTVNWEEVGLK